MEINNPDEFVMWAASLFQRAILEEKTEDFVVNVEQAQKFGEAYRYFQRLAKENGGHIENVMLQPQLRAAGFTATFPYLDLVEESVKEFASRLQDADAVTFSPSDNIMDISINIPDVFRLKP